jgi:hypothetical protein
MKTGMSKLDAYFAELLGPLGEGPRRFLAFQFLNITAWQAILGTVLILHARELGISPRYVGLLNSFNYFTNVLGLLTKPLAERIGSKRLLMSGWTLRNILVAPIVLAPWVYHRWGSPGATILLCGTTFLFCTARSLAGISWSSWLHEIVDREHLARFYTLDSMLTRLIAVTFGVLAFFWLGNHPPLWRFAAIAGVGVVLGLVSIRVLRRVPAGGPVPQADREADGIVGFGCVLRDPVFMPFIGCTALAGFVFAGQSLLLTLLLRDRLGLGPGLILLLSAMGSLLTIAAGVRWRRVADTLGSPVTIAANTLLMFVCLLAMIPLGTGRMPLPYVVAVCLLIPVSETGNYIAVTRAYMMRMDPARRHAYNAVWAASGALGGGFSSILVGQLVQDNHPLNFMFVTAGYAALMLAASARVLRLPEGGKCYQALPRSSLFNPRHPWRSMGRIWWYVIRPGHAKPLDVPAQETAP